MRYLLTIGYALLQTQFGTAFIVHETSFVRNQQVEARRPCFHRSSASFLFRDDRSDEEIEEEIRLNILQTRRSQIRNVLKSAEAIRNTRIANKWVPKVDEHGKVISDNKLAFSLTAFMVGAGAVALRIGGRAALMSTVGLDFASNNPELKDQLDQVLTASAAMNDGEKLALFTLAWTFVKLFLFDAGGIVLALSSGILFGGVIQGALASATAATIGSSIAFGMAKLDTPVRKKALDLLAEYPSLRGIEKVVASDGLKAILTLRLAPILPIPIGAYNYLYGVTNVPFMNFAGGIFLGSLKPYLLDSYIGYFGKEVLERDLGNSAGIQDVLLLLALGFSVLIGVFASQLASETLESVEDEIKLEEAAKKMEHGDNEAQDDIVRVFMGWKLPSIIVNFQTSFKKAEHLIKDMVEVEANAQVWNYSAADGGPPASRDPARLPTSPEIMEVGKQFNFSEAIYLGIALSPTLLGSWIKYADPLNELTVNVNHHCAIRGSLSGENTTKDGSDQTENLLKKVKLLKEAAKIRLDKAEERIITLEKKHVLRKGIATCRKEQGARPKSERRNRQQ